MMFSFSLPLRLPLELQLLRSMSGTRQVPEKLLPCYFQDAKLSENASSLLNIDIASISSDNNVVLTDFFFNFS